MNKELDKKLAEWAGISLTELIVYPKEYNFTESLDACFRHFEPKLDEIGEHFIVFQKRWNDYSIKQATIAFVNPTIQPNEVDGEGDTHALALCLAIEKLIDSEVASAIS